MNAEVFRALIVRDLAKLKEEIELYRSESAIWKIEKNIANTAGNLCLHLVGNLNTYIGAVLGHTGYVRDRDAEFALKNIPRKEVVKKIEDTIAMINTVMPTIPVETLEQEYPVLVLKEKSSTGYFLAHLCSHLGYHLGQVNYHRRLLD